jgi:predicted ATPase
LTKGVISIFSQAGGFMSENYISKIRINGYRRLFDVELDLTDHPLSVMIGANGVGKTSILEVFDIIGKSASKKLNDAIMVDYDGLLSIKNQNSESVSIAIQKNVENYKLISIHLR